MYLTILLKLCGYARNCLKVFFGGFFFSLFVWFWFCMRVTFHFLGIIVNTDKKKSVLPTVQLSVHVFFFSFSGSPLTGTLRETPPVSRTKTGVCCMFCVKETSQNGNILRSEGQISSSSIIQILLSIVQNYLFDHI